MWIPEYARAFCDPALRKDFVQKVLGIVFLQLLITAGICALFYTWVPLWVRPL